MNRFLSILIAVLSLAVLSQSAMARGSTWIVSPNPCPGVDFTSLQSAIDAASEGDTIIVRSSPLDTGDFEIVQKSLTIIGDQLSLYEEDPIVVHGIVRNLLAGQSVTIKGLTITEGLLLNDNAGEIWIEECSITLPTRDFNPPVQFDQMIRVRNSSSAAFVRCVWFEYPSFLGHPPNGSGKTGLRALDSTVHLFECQGTGATGDSSTQQVFGTKGFKGAPALAAISSSVNVFGSLLTGGDGGSGRFSFDGSQCGPGGDGGDALEIADITSLVRISASTLQPGIGAPPDAIMPPPLTCGTGLTGQPISGPGAGLEVLLPGVPRVARFVSNGLIRDESTVTLVLEGDPGDFTFWGVGVVQDQVFLPGFNGVSLLTPLKVFGFNFLPGSGSKTLNLPVGDLVAPGEVITLFTQGYFFDLVLNSFITSPAAVTILDSTHDVADGCAQTIYVDDDAPGDPGPSDSSVSDPLEDGTSLHPFDSIQEAVDSVVIPGVNVILMDGTYTGLGNRDVNPPSGTHVLISSENGPANCAVLVGGALLGFEFDNGTETMADGLSGLTISGATSHGILITFGSPAIRNCIIEGNSGSNGAGILANNSNPIIENCIIRGNQATNKGGGLFTANSFTTLRNCQITDNVALVEGGAASIDGKTGIEVFNCTIANNQGGGLDIKSSIPALDPLILANCLIWGNTGGPQVNFRLGTLEIDYGDVQGGLAGIQTLFGGTLITGAGFIDADPLFVDPLGSDYHLSVGSPCIDAGDPAFAPLPGELDIDGDARVQGSAVDLGSDEI